MKNSKDRVEKENFNATYAMLFFGVPNTDMNIAGIRAMFEHQPNEGFIMSLVEGSQLLRNLYRDFTDMFNFSDARIVCFYENKKTFSSVLVCLLFLTTVAVIDLLVESCDRKMVEYRGKDTRGDP